MLVDVRSPCEFLQGHIPGSINLPLFSDEERAAIGTLYKRQGHDTAVKAGLDAVAPKMAQLGQQLRVIAHEGAPTELLQLLCFRGGLRSQSMLFLAKLFQLNAVCLPGGYKGYRRSVHALFAKPWKFQLLGGFTGAGKSEYLQSAKGQVLDLELLANHSGSAFGSRVTRQPTNEQFENLIAQKLSQFRVEESILVEDESRLIGSCVVPEKIFLCMQEGEFRFHASPIEERIERILREYGGKPAEELIENTKRLEKRLGYEKVRELIQLILLGNLRAAVKILISYYDQAYSISLQKRNHCLPLQGIV